MADYPFTGHTRFGTLGGVITILWVNISSGDIWRTVILTTIGASISFTTSLLLKYCLRKWRKP